MTLRPIACLIALSLAGCAAVKGPEQPVTLRLAPPPTPLQAPLLTQPLAVVPVQARGLAGALRYDYVDAAAPSEIRQAKTLFWEEPPPHVLERALIAGLRGRFAGVTESTMPAKDARRVIVELVRFEEAGAGGEARAVVAFDATVTGTPMLAGRYCAAAPIVDPSGTTRARAFEAAIAGSVDAFARDLARGTLGATDC